MAKQKPIIIDSILGGHMPMTHFGSKGQFRASLGIDPAQPFDDTDSAYSTLASGLLRPAASEKFSSTTITAAPMWIVPSPKDANIYVQDALGSAYTVNAALTTVTALSDAGALTGSIGNGVEYYDNYMYFATGTDIARYGPLNGVPGWVPSYWTSTLGKTALSNTTYPTTYKNGLQLPNHLLKRHSDGRLYICDIVGNQGYLHYIATSKTTVEGDTNNSSTYLALEFGYGLWPTAIESFGSEIVIGFYEGSSTGIRQQPGKIAFWDTSSTDANRITWREFPDSLITAIRNVNGVLYIASGNYQTKGFRITKYVGGYSFQEVYYSETGEPPLAGAFDGVLNRIIMGSHTTVPESDGCLYGVGLQKASLGNGFFNVMRATGGDSSTNVTAAAFVDATQTGFYVPVIGWTKGSGGSNNGLDKQGSTYDAAPSVWWSDLQRIGRPFKVTSIRLAFPAAIAAGTIVTPKVYMDDGQSSKTLTAISNSNYSGKRSVKQRFEAEGTNNFWIELRWTGAGLGTVGLPIIIEWETIDD